MQHLLYDELTPFYRLLDPLEDHRAEAHAMAEQLVAATDGDCRTLLELGAGAGHNAHHVRDRFQQTLVDLSEPMLDLSRAINPDCKHVLGDMRSVRLERQFDAVLVHDAICYMTAEEDLGRAIATAFEHTRPGGAALFAPDHLLATFEESTEAFSAEDEERALRGICWTWRAAETDRVSISDYAFLLRDKGAEGAVRAVHDRHVEGLFAEQTWLDVIRGCGFAVEPVTLSARDEGGDEPTPFTTTVFVARRPVAAG